MFDAGELDALLSLYIPTSFLNGSPRIARLFPDYKEVEQDYYRRTGIFPIMHTVVVREDVHRAHPWVARNIYRAFCEARDLAVEGLYDTDALRLALPWLIDHVEEAWRVFGKDFWAYGLEPNRPTFEAIGRYVHEQDLSPRVVSAESCFCRTWSDTFPAHSGAPALAWRVTIYGASPASEPGAWACRERKRRYSIKVFAASIGRILLAPQLTRLTTPPPIRLCGEVA